MLCSYVHATHCTRSVIHIAVVHATMVHYAVLCVAKGSVGVSDSCVRWAVI